MSGVSSGLEGLLPEYDLVIVGAGLSGGTYAEQAASRFGWSSLIIDKRDHIGARASLDGGGARVSLPHARPPGGNCYDFIDSHGLRISQYGVHLFHTQASSPPGKAGGLTFAFVLRGNPP